jgi:hypothetical protein
MSYWLAQLVLAARNSDGDEKWGQILFFVILSIFWVVGNIIKKVSANKTSPKTPRKQVRKQPEPTAELQILKQFFGLPEEPEPQVAKPQVQPQVRKVARPAIPQTAKPQAAKPQVQPKIEKAPELTAAMPQVEAVVPAETSQAKYLSEILSDYENPESLKRAILHFEILGKPISLRGPLERFF